MNFSWLQWIFLVFADLMLRFMYILYFNDPMLVPPFVFVFLLNIFLLIVIGSVCTMLELNASRSVFVTLISANFLFLVIDSIFWWMLIADKTSYFCDELGCLWKGGSVSWRGVKALSLDAALQVAFNVLPTALVLFSARLRKKLID